MFYAISFPHKRSVVSTLLRGAQNIPSTQKGKHEERRGVKAVLPDNNYPSSFINSCERLSSKLPTDLPSNGFAVLRYVQGISERISWILRQHQIKLSFKPLRTVNSLFPEKKRLTGHNLAQCAKSVAPIAVLYTTVKPNDHSKLALQNRKGLLLCLTTTPRLPAMSTKTTTKWILQVSELLDMRLTTTSDFSWKPGTQ